MVVGCNNGVVGLTGFSNKKMRGLLFGPQKSGPNKGGVVVFNITESGSKEGSILFGCASGRS